MKRKFILIECNTPLTNRALKTAVKAAMSEVVTSTKTLQIMVNTARQMMVKV